jgi:hypothetical protein
MNQPTLDNRISDGDEYLLYLDDIGSGKPGLNDAFPMFGLGGCIVKKSDEPIVRQLLRDFKQKWGIALNIPLHGAEIRAEKDNFRWLKADKEKCIEFKKDVLRFVLTLPIVVHACIVDRAGYYRRYHEKYNRASWDMRKSAAVILLERSCKFVKHQGGKSLAVTFELCGKTEDFLFRQSYADLRNKGNLFNESSSEKYKPAGSTELSQMLGPIAYGRGKSEELLQIADLCLFPVATAKNGKPNVAMDAFRSSRLIVDELVSDSAVAIKYYCFDEEQKSPLAS